MTVQFISLISRDDRPLYIQSFDGEGESPNDFLKYNFLSHMALDVYASPTLIGLRELQQADDSNTAVLLLFIQDGTAVYGLETNNGLKIVAGLAHKDGSAISKVRVHELFSLIQKCYLRATFNPFATGDEEAMLQNGAFDKNVKSIVDGWGVPTE